MARDKAKDDKHFNCSEKFEHDYVAGLYPGREKDVRDFLKGSCERGDFHNTTHKDLYDLIHQKFGLLHP